MSARVAVVTGLRTLCRSLTWLLAISLAACAHLQPRPELPVQTAIASGDNSPLDGLIAAAEARRPGQSAFRLLVEGSEAFVIRVRSARMAARSLDVQTYIWHADLTGMYIAHTLIEAADRGVKVRVLVDDLDARAMNAGLAAVAAHPNVEVRLFNPFASRSGTLRLIGEGLTSFDRINRRMHNKTWIADNRVAIAGGRNLGDEYFGASDEVNFVDLDFAMIGPVVRDASASFDKYWNSPSAYPIEALATDAVNVRALDSLRTRLAAHAREVEASRYAIALRSDDAVQRLINGDWPMQWSPKYLFVSDDPLKVTMLERPPEPTGVVAALVPVAKAAQSELTIISPYFVPSGTATPMLVDVAQSGKSVRVLTNSLVANDVAAVHGGYSRYRQPLLAGGVQLWELKPLTDEKADSSMFGSSGASLHTKALIADKRTLFVGSYNLDPRSTWLNCEQGVLVENEVLAMQLNLIFAAQTAGQRSWRVTLEEQKLRWSDGRESFDSDPRAPLSRRFQAWITRVLHLDAQL